jgi:LCP family protein required for cell wall assembly
MSRKDGTGDNGGNATPTRRGDIPQRQRRSRRRRIIGWIAVLTTVLVTGTSLAAYAAYLNDVHSIETFKITKENLGPHRPPAYNSSENILVVGSDSRAGSNRKFGANVQGQRSDTMILLHIRPDHRGAVVVSLPRDSEVPVLSCTADGLGDPGQPAEPGQTEMLNATFAYGGPQCLWRTVEQETGIRVDHYIGLTFTGFEKVINDLGGVNVCLPEAIKDPKSGINLTAGLHHVFGPQALAFWRERYVGEGSDLQRIQRQQYLMAGLMQEVKTGGLLTDYPKMYSALTDSAKALTTDQGLSVSDMLSLAEDLRGLSESSVQFVTVPNVPDPADNDRVLWEQPQANRLFYAVAHDTALPSGKTATPTTTSPGNVQVEVLNGDGLQGAAAGAAGELTGRGFKVVKTGNASKSDYTTSVIEYATSSDMTEVNTLKAAIGSANVQEVPSLTPGTVDLIIGSNFKGLTNTSPSTTGSSSGSTDSSNSADNLSQAYGGITGDANICKDQNAFTGPDNPSAGS